MTRGTCTGRTLQRLPGVLPVMNKRAVDVLGADTLSAMNAGRLAANPRLRTPSMETATAGVIRRELGVDVAGRLLRRPQIPGDHPPQDAILSHPVPRDVDQALTLLSSLDRDKQLMTRDITAIDLRLPDRVSVRLSIHSARPAAGVPIELTRIDGDGRPKPLWYATRRFFAPLARVKMGFIVVPEA